MFARLCVTKTLARAADHDVSSQENERQLRSAGYCFHKQVRSGSALKRRAKILWVSDHRCCERILDLTLRIDIEWR
jgi:hypothetical protein